MSILYFQTLDSWKLCSSQVLNIHLLFLLCSVFSFSLFFSPFSFHLFQTMKSKWWSLKRVTWSLICAFPIWIQVSISEFTQMNTGASLLKGLKKKPILRLQLDLGPPLQELYFLPLNSNDFWSWWSRRRLWPTIWSIYRKKNILGELCSLMSN